MAKNYDKIDLYWSRSGDLIMNNNGDLLDTEQDRLRSLVQEVRTRIQSDQQDWDLYPDLGANLSALIGQPNNKITAESGKAKIIAALTMYGLVDSGDISIIYMPIDEKTIVYRLKIKVSPTVENRAVDSLKIDIIYNYQDDNLHLL